MLSHEKVRDLYLTFFEKHGHSIQQSAPLIPLNDPSLLFTSAGMVPFKDLFLGKETRSFTRAASIQKCLRTNDIERVGHTARHLTFFEMMGNFSFGDYFKEDAIQWAWEFLTEYMKLPKEKLYITIYKDDEESRVLWKQFVSDNRLYKLGEDSNFWAIGETGPCGPCSEILFDRGASFGCGSPSCAPGCDCDRYLEVWNLVFTQFDRQKDGSLLPLPKKNIDTGMGLERLLSVVQQVPSNFATDVFQPLWNAVNSLGKEQNSSFAISETALRIISDHARAATFLLCDGVFPSNEGRGYVLKRLIRRAARHGIAAGLNEFLYKISGEVIAVMKHAYPELVEKRDYCAEVLLSEEQKFRETLTIGTRLVDELKHTYREKKHIPGAELFKLFDTYGLPLDFSKEMLEGYTIDEQGFHAEMEQQKTRARKNVEGWDKEHNIYTTLSEKHGATQFVGYTTLYAAATIVAIVKSDTTLCDTASVNDGEIALVLDITPLYGESGGQHGDKGIILCIDAQGDVVATMRVHNTKKPATDITVHYGTIIEGIFSVGKKVVASVDAALRDAVKKNHTATHLLQAALRKNCGAHIKQSGSDVDANGLRFDFTHPKAIDAATLRVIEQEVNEAIQKNSPVTTRVMDADTAKASGALAFFGEKYGATVRVVMIGDENAPVSVEFCGGTHCTMTGEIGVFTICSESSIASGVRRIEAVTGLGGVAYMQEKMSVLDDVAIQLKVSPTDVLPHIEQMQKKIKQLEKDIAAYKTEQLKADVASVLSNACVVNNVPILVHSVTGIGGTELRTYADMLREKLKGVVFVVSAMEDDTYQLICTVSKQCITSQMDAREIIKKVALQFGGKGGGKPDMAQAGLKGNVNVKDLIASVESVIEKLVDN